VKEVEVEVRAEEKKLPEIGLRSRRKKKRNLILTLKEGEVHREDNMTIEILFHEQEEEEEAEEVR
jgi:hypothetical protein